MAPAKTVDTLTLVCSHGGLMCAGIDRKCWPGETVVFCSQHKGLWCEKASQQRDRLVLCAGPTSLAELLSMKKALPKYRVRTRHVRVVQPHAMTAFPLEA